ncbi:MAG: hypothetical protein M1269_05560 [Chloroflexi bacterium]|nr:hypothetical protein [Chloroflexota bacterium]
MSEEKRLSKRIILFVILLGSISLLFWFYNNYFIYREPPEYPSACRAILKNLHAAFDIYLKEHENRFPPVWKNNEYLWVEALRPIFLRYGTNYKVYRYSPLDKRRPLPPSSYKFNTALAGKSLKSIKNPDKVILLYEDEPRIKLYEDKHHYKLKAAYLFLDGHVEFK